MRLRQRLLRWLLSPVALVVVTYAALAGLEEWQSAGRTAQNEKREAERQAGFAAEQQAWERRQEAMPPLFKAIRSGDAQAVRAAIAQGADPNAPDDRGTRPLNFAFLKGGGWPGRRDVVEALLAAGADVNGRDVRSRPGSGNTALNLAVTRSDREVVELLLERGADVDAKGSTGYTPVMNAERLEIADLLVARGAKWNNGESGIDPTGYRLRQAARQGDVQRIEQLLSRGADPNRGRMPIIVSAIGARRAEAVRVLLAAGAKVDARLDDGSRPLHVAAELNQVEIARLLIDGGADVKAARSSGWTPLHVASSRCHEELAELLIASGANRNALDKHGRAPLACYAFANKPPRGSAVLIASCRV